MPSECKATLIGHLARDPEIKFTQSNLAICTFTVPADTGRGEKKKTTWWRVTVFGKAAETSHRFLKKGSMVKVVGDASLNEWTNKDGVVKTGAELAADSVMFLNTKNRHEGAPAAGDAPNWGPPKSAPAPDREPGADDDLPPF